MSELDELIKQKKEIEKKIKDLKSQASAYGAASCAFERYPTDLPDRWYVALDIAYVGTGYKRKSSRRSIINGASKQEVIAKIPDVIRDLQGLYEQETK